MRPDTRNAIGALVLFGALFALVQSTGSAPTSLDPRRSTFLHGPDGAAGLADALGRLGIRTERLRQRYATLFARDSAGSDQTAFAVLDPAEMLDRSEGIRLADWPRTRGDLVLAGGGASTAMACFGYRSTSRTDTAAALSPVGTQPFLSVRISHILARNDQAEVVDSAGSALSLTRCTVPAIARAETLLVTRTGRAVAVRLWPEGYQGRVTLVADGGLFSNRALRETDAGVFALGLFADRDSVVIFDERHQGFVPTGSLLGSVMDWSEHSPWGWAGWQLILVGLVLLLFGAVRFGPARPLNDRKRRSALEHVQALATALSAAQGHDTAIHLMIHGLARRLRPEGRRVQDTDQLLVRLSPIVRTASGREALAQLKTLTRPGQPAGSVLIAANAVEDVWQDLRP